MTQLHARDLMQRDIMTVTPETPLIEVHRLFVEEEINGAPVVDEAGGLRGVVSSMDLVRAVLDQSDTGAAASADAYYREALPFSGADWGASADEVEERFSDLTAGDVMIRELVTVRSDTTLAVIAATMRRQRIHRLLVVDDGELLGIVTTFDLLRAFEAEPGPRLAGENPRAAGDPVC